MRVFASGTSGLRTPLPGRQQDLIRYYRNMSLPIRHLPLLQHWDCHGCTNCCRDYRVFLTEEERQRIVASDWHDVADLAGTPLVVREGQGGRYRLNQRADGCCVFLSEQGRCRLHERFGSQAKPLPCRLYPFVLVPAGDHWRGGLRFSCPSAAQDQGKSLAEHEAELRTLARELEQQERIAERILEPPDLQRGQRVAWSDVLRFVQALQSILQNRRETIERRWRKCLALAALCRQARFEQVKGERLTEFLRLVVGGLDAEVPADPTALPPPTWIGRTLFRPVLAILIRKDAGPERGPATGSRWALLHAAWRFARGRGRVPLLHARLPAITFEQLEAPLGPWPAEAEQILERYYLVKVGSLQFCGPANFQLPFWTGLEALALTLPAIGWLVRAWAALPRTEAVTQAVRLVDHNFGYHPRLGSRWQRFSLHLLSQLEELPKLIGWYGR